MDNTQMPLGCPRGLDIEASYWLVHYMQGVWENLKVIFLKFPQSFLTVFIRQCKQTHILILSLIYNKGHSRAMRYGPPDPLYVFFWPISKTATFWIHILCAPHLVQDNWKVDNIIYPLDKSLSSRQHGLFYQLLEKGHVHLPKQK